MKEKESGLDPAPVFLLCEGALCSIPSDELTNEDQCALNLLWGPQTADSGFCKTSAIV